MARNPLQHRVRPSADIVCELLCAGGADAGGDRPRRGGRLVPGAAAGATPVRRASRRTGIHRPTDPCDSAGADLADGRRSGPVEDVGFADLADILPSGEVFTVGSSHPGVAEGAGSARSIESTDLRIRIGRRIASSSRWGPWDPRGGDRSHPVPTRASDIVLEFDAVGGSPRLVAWWRGGWDAAVVRAAGASLERRDATPGSTPTSMETSLDIPLDVAEDAPP